jgi:hypothetical protein
VDDIEEREVDDCMINYSILFSAIENRLNVPICIVGI